MPSSSLLLGATAMVASCGAKSSDTTPTDTTPPHSHTYGEWTVTTPATCGAAGEETRTCDCGETETRPVPATEDHAYGDWTVTTPATCTTAGEETRTCGTCGAADTREVPVNDNHSYDDGVVTTEPTEVTDGEKTYTCSGCDDTYTEAIPCTGEPVKVGVSYIGSALLCGLTGVETYTPAYMYSSNLVDYDESDNSYWLGVSFGTSTTPAALSGFVEQILAAYSYSEIQPMADDDGWYYGYYADEGVSTLEDDTILYEVDCYTNSKGATALQVIGNYAPAFMA